MPSQIDVFDAIRDLDAVTDHRLPTVVAALRDAANHGGFRPEALLGDVQTLMEIANGD
jgi:hypothetical protein